ncbi:dienelactone hydrolase family protein [Sphingomonas quercus]|uniref:Dienelactone hydrolase family protein n=1 Tax=Sphingomonas quercus TaxID=2842451 RepID=A0ABS6BFI3_9SPHN|nr:dienelactone hydrolase family protein [Sphingomonas quercus]MBU3077053.1 dienelactone hydrolase family protein [Sphingomonas quercus]
MTIEARAHVWEGPGGPFEGHLAFAAGREPRPGILIAPTIMGVTDLERGIAARLAERGYVALVADVYGQARHPATMDEARPLMDALNADRPLLAARMAAAFDALRQRGNVDPARTAAFGYCFGGKCVLDLARAGEPVTGVVTFHGLLDPPPAGHGEISARLLVLHGWDDPLATPDQVEAFAREMTAARVDWQLHAYGHTVHAFTNPNREGMYSPVAEARSWRAAMNFLDELFG